MYEVLASIATYSCWVETRKIASYSGNLQECTLVLQRGMQCKEFALKAFLDFSIII